MRSMISILGLSAALLAGPVVAQDAGVPEVPAADGTALVQVSDPAAFRLTLARKLIALMQTDQMADMMNQVTASFAVDDPRLNAEEQAMMDEVSAEMVEMMIPRMFDAMAPIYADIFTIEELQAVIEFYESDVGRSMLKKSYAAAPLMIEAVQDLMPEMMGEMADRICNRMECTPTERRQMKAEMMRAIGY